MLATALDAPFTLSDLPRLGITRRRLRAMLSAAVVRRVVRGVYAPTSLGDGLAVRAQAVALVLPEGYAACDRTAAWLHGIDLYPYADHDAGLEVEMCVGPGRTASRRDGIGGHRRTLLDDEVMDVEGIAVTTPLRTAVDLACVLRRRDALAALDAFRRTHDLSEASLSELMRRRYRGRRGVVQARALIPLSDPRSESIRESWVRVAIIDAGLPSPEPQVWIVVGGVPTYRIDLAYVGLRVAVEYDGFDDHLKNEEQIRNDEERRAWLRAHGWKVIVVQNGDFTGDRLDRWLRKLRLALRPSYSNRRKLERGSGEL